MSIDRRMEKEKEDVVHICNGIRLSHKKEWNNAAPWMDLEVIILSEIRKQKTNTI